MVGEEEIHGIEVVVETSTMEQDLGIHIKTEPTLLEVSHQPHLQAFHISRICNFGSNVATCSPVALILKKILHKV